MALDDIILYYQDNNNYKDNSNVENIQTKESTIENQNSDNSYLATALNEALEVTTFGLLGSDNQTFIV